MCYQRKLILQRSRTKYPGMPLYRWVACGECPECISAYQDAWIFRAIYQYRHTISCGGRVAFITLTYDDFHLPIFRFSKKHHRLDGFTTPCFSRADIKRFRMRLGKALMTYYGWTNEELAQIHYIICSEYGSNNTKRSHYHGLIYFPKPITESDLVKLLRFSWVERHPRGGKQRAKATTIEQDYKRFNQLGIFSQGSKGWFVTSENAIAYVCKYTSKDMNGFNDIHGLKEYIKDPVFLCQIQDYLPFHVQSMGFGECAKDMLSDEDLIAGRVYIGFDSALDGTLNPSSKDYKIPTYVFNKVFCDKHPLHPECLIRNGDYWRLLPYILDEEMKQGARKIRECGLTVHSQADLFGSAYYAHPYALSDELNIAIQNVLNDPERYIIAKKFLNLTKFGISQSLLDAMPSMKKCDLRDMYIELMKDKELNRFNELCSASRGTVKNKKKTATDYNIRYLSRSYEIYCSSFPDDVNCMTYDEYEEQFVNTRHNALLPYNVFRDSAFRKTLEDLEIFEDIFPEYALYYSLEHLNAFCERRYMSDKRIKDFYDIKSFKEMTTDTRRLIVPLNNYYKNE